MPMPRRTFLLAAPTALAAAAQLAAAPPTDRQRGRDLAGEFGVTTGSFTRNLSRNPAPGKLMLIDLPKIMRDELDLKVIDLMTATLPSLSPEFCDAFRNEAEKTGRVITNLKMNQKDCDLGAADDSVYQHSLEVYKQTIDAAARLGCRWVRPASQPKKPQLARLAEGFRVLIDYAGPRGITLLAENNGWISKEPDALPQIVKAVGEGIAVQPDTGNWAAAVRYEGLEKAFPLAVTCDFKAMKLGPAGEHAEYDLRRCFDIAWKAGFRGPWCFEHFNEELSGMWKDLVLLRQMLQRWTAERG